MEEQKKKKRSWSFLLPSGKPVSKQRMELKKIKDNLVELEIDIEGFAFDTEADFREFVLATTTPGDCIVEFLKKSFDEADIEYVENGFRRLTKSMCLELFFELFTLGANEGETPTPIEQAKSGDSSDDAEQESKKNVPDAGEAEEEEQEQLTAALMDDLYRTGKKEKVTSISYMDFIVTDQIPVRAQDNFSLRLRENAPAITHSKAALFNTHLKKTVAVGRLMGSSQEPKLVFLAEDMDYDSLQKNRKHEIILFPEEERPDLFYAVPCELGFRKLEEANRTLCIDFGTSNTTAGSYGILDEQANQPEIVRFPDITETTTRRMIPTLVYIDSCEDGQPIRYAFGYEAKRRIMTDHFESKATVFHEIKSWMNDLEREEEIFDAQGNNGMVRREEVIKAYLSHIISLSEQYFHKRFKYLHFSAPVKLKDSFLHRMRQMFPAPTYQVLSDDASIDEGIAIVYHHIAERIKEMDEGQSKTVFVIDCGGGTTDLARCEYSQTASSIGEGKKILSVKTRFENGDSAFGGNNITYRILQLLKIKIDACLQQKPNPDMLQLISENENDIMTKLDDALDKNLVHVKEELYKDFTLAYEAAEERIPTRYQEAKFNDDRRFMRRNYNYLWQMAETIKIEFYKSSSTVSVDFAKEEDRSICIGGQDDYYLYTRKTKDSVMEKTVAPLGNICITIKEINRIICPDIYVLLSILLGGYDDRTLQEVDFYKLSGQSCNITLFHDLMKEFVPGRNIRRDDKNTNKEDRTDELKIACIKGSIRYLMAKEFSQIQPKIEMGSPKMLYKIYATFEDEEPQMALGNEGAHLLRSFISARRIHLIVKDAYGQQKNSVFYNFELAKDKRKNVSLADLELQLLYDTYWGKEEVYERIIVPLNNITLHGKDETEQSIFLLPAKNGYGFRIYQIRISYGENGETNYALIKNQKNGTASGEYHSFEQMASFFDGKR